MKNFGQEELKKFLPEWKNLTSDPMILGLVNGTEIPLEEIPHQHKIPQNQVQGNLRQERGNFKIIGNGCN